MEIVNYSKIQTAQPPNVYKTQMLKILSSDPSIVKEADDPGFIRYCAANDPNKITQSTPIITENEHESKKKYFCDNPNCLMEFSRWKKCQQHIVESRHGVIGKYFCDYPNCLLEFIKWSKLTKHIWKSHRQKIERRENQQRLRIGNKKLIQSTITQQETITIPPNLITQSNLMLLPTQTEESPLIIPQPSITLPPQPSVKLQPDLTEESTLITSQPTVPPTLTEESTVTQQPMITTQSTRTIQPTFQNSQPRRDPDDLDESKSLDEEFYLRAQLEGDEYWIEFPLIEKTFNHLYETLLQEFEIDPQKYTIKMARFPNTMIRKDWDVARLQISQEICVKLLDK